MPGVTSRARIHQHPEVVDTGGPCRQRRKPRGMARFVVAAIALTGAGTPATFGESQFAPSQTNHNFRSVCSFDSRTLPDMHISLLEHLPSTLLQASPSRDLMKGQMLYRRGERATGVFLVEQGRLRLYSVDAEGRDVPLYVIRHGECVSEAALFADTYCGNVMAEVRSRVRCFPKERLLDALHNDPELSSRYMSEMARRFNSLRVRLELRNLKSARERILQYLITSAPGSGDSLLIDRPLKSIADDLGLTPESLYRAFADLASSGKLTRTRKMIVLHRGAIGAA